MGCGSSAAADASKPAAAKPAAETKKAERKLTRLKQTVIESDEETSLASVGCDLHVLACYNGENWDAKNYKRLPEGVIEVTLQKLKAPAVLLLSIYDATLWRITLASGARSSLLRVYLSGHHKVNRMPGLLLVARNADAVAVLVADRAALRFSRTTCSGAARSPFGLRRSPFPAIMLSTVWA